MIWSIGKQSKKFVSKKILLFGLNFGTKLAMKQLLKLDIFIEGFF